MQPVLLWPRPQAAIAEYLERGPDDFIVVDTDHFHELQKLHKLRRDTPIFDPFPGHGHQYRDFLNHITASGCRYHIIGLAACQDVLRTLKDPSLAGATIEEILSALGYLDPKRSKPAAAMSPLTIFLARLIGLFLVLVSLSMLTHKQTMVETANALVHDRPLLLIVGMIALIGGLAMVLSHNIWSGGVLPVIVTLLGWSILIRGLLLLFLPPDAMVGLFEMLHFEELFYIYAAIAVVLGLYLTYAGFRSLLPSSGGAKR
jgi:hypothetical protein